MNNSTKFALSIFLVTTALIALNVLSTDVTANTSAAPASKTGSPGDGGLTCTGCHSGTATTAAGLITSTIPAAGYLPGQTYTITASVTQVGKTKFGFEISPQNPSGTKLGTLVITDAVNTKLVGTSKYVTHTSAGTSHSSGTATWSFNWTAPAIGSGPVTFYGAFNITNNNASSSGDIIQLSTLVVTQDVTAGIDDENALSEINIYPNPSTDKIFISKLNTPQGIASVSIIDVEGKLVKKIDEVGFNSPIYIDELPKGYYVVKIETDGGIAIKKIIKQ